MGALTMEINQPLLATLERLSDGAPLNELCIALLEDGIAATLQEMPMSRRHLPKRRRFFQNHRSRLVDTSSDDTV